MSADVLLVLVRAEPGADSRVVEALPWLIRQYASYLGLSWLVRQGKLQNLQNRGTWDTVCHSRVGRGTTAAGN